MSIRNKILKVATDRRLLALAAGAFLLTLLAAWAAWHAGVRPADLSRWFNQLLEFLRDRPLYLFFGIVILPAFPVPASALLILAGIVYGPKFGMPMACAITGVAMLLNMTWTYFAAAYPARNFVERLLKRMDVKIPVLTKGHVVRLIVILRITPGFPFFFQNLVLGFMRVPFRLYLVLSAALSSIGVIGFVVSGGAIFKGNFGLALGGIALVVLAVTLMGWLRRKLARKEAV